jgi:hypothetical protein
MAIDRDPIHLFLEYQLPQMISQAKEAEKNRMHEKDMVQVREDSRMRTIEHEAELNDERALNKLNYELALKDREEKLQTIKTGQQKLMEQGIMLEQFQKIKEEDTSTGGTEIFKLVQGETERELLNNLDQFNSLEEGIAQINTKDAQLDETIDILQRVQVAQNIGSNIGDKVTDLTGDDNVTEEDFLSYIKLYQDLEQPLFDTSTVEGQLQQQAFMEQIPNLNEGLGYGTQIRNQKKLEGQIKELESKSLLNEAKAFAKQTGVSGYSAGNTALIKNQEAKWDKLPSRFQDATDYDMTKMKLTKGHNYTEDQVQEMLSGLQENIVGQLLESERGVSSFYNILQSTESTDDTLENILVAIQEVDPDDRDGNRAVMDSLNAYLENAGISGLESELDYSNMPLSGDEHKAAQFILDEVGQYKYLQSLLGALQDPAGLTSP